MFKWIGDLGSKVAATITKALAAWFNGIVDTIHDLLVKFITSVLISIEKDYSKVLYDIVSLYEKIPDLPPELKRLIQEIKNPKHQVTALIGNSLMSSTIGGMTQGLIGTILEPVTQSFRALLTPNLPDLGILINLSYRNLITDSDAQYLAKRLGWKPEWYIALKELSRPLLPPDLTIQGWFRGIISEEVVNTILSELGYRKFEIELIKRLSYYFPSVGDLIRFAVREVFSPAVVNKFRMDEDYPQEFEEQARKVGLSPEWARAYWRAHWELPSPTMGFEMYHRGLITYEELNLLLRTLDIMPYWRDKLIQLSYNVPTRVDIRRIYQLGIRDKKWVYENYRKLGYSPEDAEALTEFAVRGATEEERDLTKAEILNGYKTGIISRDETIRMLENMGYDKSEAEFLVSLQDVTSSKEKKDLDLKIIKTQYQKKIITKEQAIAAMNALNLTSREIDYYLLSWEKEQKSNVALPSKADLTKFLKAKIITEEKYKEFMKALGYPDDIIDMYLQFVKKGGEVE